MEKETFAAVVFDMDGVIFDTEKLVVKCWKAVAEKYGIPDIEATVRSCLGCNQQKSEEKFRQRYGEDFPYWDRKLETRELFFGPYYGEHLPIKPGVVELLSKLKERNIPVALATSSSQKSVLMELEDAKLISYFDKIICGDMVTHSKPHPEIFLKACEELGVKPEDTYAVEDSYNGIRAAHAGGLMTVMVPDLLEPTEEINPLLTECFSSLVDFSEYLFEANEKA